jgi:glycerol-3-phosphate acyltransferase PlsY
MTLQLAMIILSYLLGAIPCGLIISRRQQGIDIREHGSGNIGTSNVLRTLGRRAAVLTLVGDVVKGGLPVILGRWWGLSEAWLAAAGVAAIVGHNWPVYIGFRGGKGVATGFGAALALMPGITGLALAVYLLTAALTRYTSLSALLSSASLLLFAQALKASQPRVLFSLVSAVLIYVRHRENIQRLIQGTERKIGQSV